jgi:hypothetical protein
MTGYQYTLVRYVHNEGSGECVNVGLAFLAPEERFLRVTFNRRYSRISQFFRKAFDGDHYRNMIRALGSQFDQIAKDLKNESSMLAPFRETPNDLAEIMERILPEDSTTFRWGPICGGVTKSTDARFGRLFKEFVTRHDRPKGTSHRQESRMWVDFERRVNARNLKGALKPYTLKSNLYQYEFYAGFQNGKPNIIEPISLDCGKGPTILEKANIWTGRLLALKDCEDFAFHAILAPPANQSLREYFDQARRVLGSQDDVVRHLIVENEDDDQLEELLEEIDSANQAHAPSDGG